MRESKLIRFRGTLFTYGCTPGILDVHPYAIQDQFFGDLGLEVEFYFGQAGKFQSAFVGHLKFDEAYDLSFQSTRGSRFTLTANR